MWHSREPVPGLVLRYSCLWAQEHKREQEEGVKDRPCAVILVATKEDGERVLTVLPITHSPPADPGLAVEIPAPVKRRLKLDDDRTCGRQHRRIQRASVMDSYALFEQIRTKFIAAIRSRRASVVPRSE